MSTDGWLEMENVVYTYTAEYYSAFCNNIESIMLSETSQQKKTNIICSHLYVES